MIKGTTKTGFNFEISEDALNDYEMLELLGDLEENPLLLPKVIKTLLGEEQKDALIEHVRSDSGRVLIDRIGEEITDIFKSNSDLKNSSTSPGLSATKGTN